MWYIAGTNLANGSDVRITCVRAADFAYSFLQRAATNMRGDQLAVRQIAENDFRIEVEENYIFTLLHHSNARTMVSQICVGDPDQVVHPNLFGKILILERAMVVRGAIFSASDKN
jgi:hypothetical protein